MDPSVGKILWRRKRQPTPEFWPGKFHELYSPWGCKEWDMTERLSLSLQVALAVKNLPANADGRDAGLISGSGRCPGTGRGNPLQDSCLENPMDRRAQWSQAMGCKESDTTEAPQLIVALQCCVSFLQYKLAPLNMSLFSMYEKYLVIEHFHDSRFYGL